MSESRDWHTHEELAEGWLFPSTRLLPSLDSGSVLPQVSWLSFSMASRGYSLVHEHEAHPTHCIGLRFEVQIC